MSEQDRNQTISKRRRNHSSRNQNSTTQSIAMQRPLTKERKAWIAYWESQEQPWRTEPEIDEERQIYLAERRTIMPNVEQGIYPFKDIKLTRADVEWLLATHDNGKGPVDWDDESQRQRKGLDLRGADLRGVDLYHLRLARMRGGLSREEWYRATEEQRKMAAVHLEGANLVWSHLEGSDLRKAHLENVDFEGARLEKAHLRQAHLEGSHLEKAHLEETNLRYAHLEGCDLRGTYLEGADLNNVSVGNDKHIGPLIADVRWGDINHAAVGWAQVSMLNDEYIARQKSRNGKAKNSTTRLHEFQAASRANRQLAVVLQNQGLNEEATRFAYRAQYLQREVFWYQGKFGQYFFSLFLDLLTGYGYKPIRSFISYAVVISVFAFIYHLLGLHLAWNEAIVISMTAFHGRGFFPDQFHPGDPQALVAAIEAFVGLLIEVTFIATLTQRLFGK